jgi:hypothetical protein
MGNFGAQGVADVPIPDIEVVPSSSVVNAVSLSLGKSEKH